MYDKIKGNDPAFATPDNGTESLTTWQGQKGLTKREYFSALAMQGMLSSIDGFSIHPDGTTQNLARCAVAQADALIEELNK